MTDQYPSVGLLQRSDTTVLRVVTSWRDGVKLRDYELSFDPVSVRPIGPPAVPRASMSLATPMLSKDGRMLAARDEVRGSTVILALDRAISCTLQRDLQTSTSKVGFSPNGELIAYSVADSSEAAMTWSHTYVTSLSSGRTTRLRGTASLGLVIPEFVANDTVLVLSTGRVVDEFRTICCFSSAAGG